MRQRFSILCISCGLLLLGGAAHANPDEDFADRVSHPDVVFSEGFDDQPAVDDKRHPDGNEDLVTFAEAQRASGAGSIQFEIPPNSYANTGSWKTNFADDNYSIKFRSGDNLYVQWRQRFSADFLRTVFDTTDGSSGGWKQVIIGEGDYEGWDYGDVNESSSCTPLEVVVNNGGQRAFPQMYHNCGDYWPYSEAFSSEYNNNDFLLQNAVFNSDGTNDRERYVLWSQAPTLSTEVAPDFPGLAYYPDEWMTFQIHIAPGPLGTAEDPLGGGEKAGFTDSIVEMWVAREAEPAVLTHSFSGVILQRGDWDQDTDEAYGKVWLLPYHTDKDAAQAHPTGYTWYDELIVSSSRIADPGFPSEDPTGGSDSDSGESGDPTDDDGSATSGDDGDSGPTGTSGPSGDSSDPPAGNGESGGDGCSCSARGSSPPLFAFAAVVLACLRRRRGHR